MTAAWLCPRCGAVGALCGTVPCRHLGDVAPLPVLAVDTLDGAVWALASPSGHPWPAVRLTAGAAGPLCEGCGGKGAILAVDGGMARMLCSPCRLTLRRACQVWPGMVQAVEWLGRPGWVRVRLGADTLMMRSGA